MVTPSALVDPNGRYCRCHGGDFSRKSPHLRAAYALNVQTPIRGTGIGFRTFLPTRLQRT